MHPSGGELIRYRLEGRGLPEVRRRRVENHLAACSSCTTRLGELDDLLLTMRTDRTPEPPKEWVDRAIQIFSKRPFLERIREWSQGLSERFGQVAFDSSAGLALAGTRQVGAGRRLRFETGRYELDVLVEPSGKGGTLTGQVLEVGDELEPVANARFLVTAGDSEMVTGATDEHGEFTVAIPKVARLHVRVVVEDGFLTFVVPES